MTAAVDGTRAHRKKEKRRSLKNKQTNKQTTFCVFAFCEGGVTDTTGTWDALVPRKLHTQSDHGTLVSQGSFTHSLIMGRSCPKEASHTV